MMVLWHFLNILQECHRTTLRTLAVNERSGAAGQDSYVIIGPVADYVLLKIFDAPCESTQPVELPQMII